MNSEDCYGNRTDCSALAVGLGSLAVRNEIDVENRRVMNQDCVIWTRLGHLKSVDKGSGAHIREDHTMAAT